MKVVLYQPQIPQNCGNIVRTCAVTGCDLVLVRPLGFSISDRWLKRAGLDYWEGVNVIIVDSLEEIFDQVIGGIYFFSSKATRLYDNPGYGPDDLLVFGSETSGLPEEIVSQWADNFRTIPMRPKQRCLNLATSVGIVVYEAWRQQGFS